MKIKDEEITILICKLTINNYNYKNYKERNKKRKNESLCV